MMSPNDYNYHHPAPPPFPPPHSQRNLASLAAHHNRLGLYIGAPIAAFMVLCCITVIIMDKYRQKKALARYAELMKDPEFRASQRRYAQDDVEMGDTQAGVEAGAKAGGNEGGAKAAEERNGATAAAEESKNGGLKQPEQDASLKQGTKVEQEGTVEVGQRS